MVLAKINKDGSLKFIEDT